MSLKQRLAAIRHHAPEAVAITDAIPEQISPASLHARREAIFKKHALPMPESTAAHPLRKDRKTIPA